VTTDEIPFLCAANGVIAENINRLHAHRTDRTLVNHWETKTVQHSDTEVAWRKNSIIAIITGRHGGQKSRGMGLSTPRQTLKLTIVQSPILKSREHGLIKLERSHLLRHHLLGHSRRAHPNLAGSNTGLVPTCSVGQIGMINNTTKTKTTKLGGEGSTKTL
jgi:hypothetical protein